MPYRTRTTKTMVAASEAAPAKTRAANKAAPIGRESPKYTSIRCACEITGLGRSTIYKLAGDGIIRFVKVGARTLVDIEHAMRWMAKLPVARIGSTSKSPT
jgi:excisionase family DNA binding protein